MISLRQTPKALFIFMEAKSYSSSPFAQAVLNYYDQFGRKNLPWQQEKTFYKVWLSEIMLQQTQVATVIPYFEQFVKKFPTIGAVAFSPVDEVLHQWTGLGYYARARNLHRAAQTIQEKFQGEFPQTLEDVMSLPGIGRSTAAAILSSCLNVPYPILDGNVKRVLCRYFLIDGVTTQSSVEKKLWQQVEAVAPRDRCGDFNQAMMDIGAMVCTRSSPKCDICPLNEHCQAFKKDCWQDYPQKKKKKSLPVREGFFLIEKEGNKVRLEKRQETGIWGGLYCFPQYDSREALLDELRSRDISVYQELTGFRHTFTHFHLEIVPIFIEPLENKTDKDRALGQWKKVAKVKQKSQQNSRTLLQTTGVYWYDLALSPSIGLATPIKNLLNQLKTKG